MLTPAETLDDHSVLLGLGEGGRCFPWFFMTWIWCYSICSQDIFYFGGGALGLTVAPVHPRNSFGPVLRSPRKYSKKATLHLHILEGGRPLLKWCFACSMGFSEACLRFGSFPPFSFVYLYFVKGLKKVRIKKKSIVFWEIANSFFLKTKIRKQKQKQRRWKKG